MSDNLLPNEIPHIQAQDPVSAEKSGAPDRALEQRLWRLEQLLKANLSAAANSRFVIPDQPAADDVTLWSSVYFNPNTGRYEKGLASVTFTSTFTLNPTAMLVGIVVAKSGNQVDVMTGGYYAWVSSDQIVAMLEDGEEFASGVAYYLSATTPGKITRYSPSLPIQVLTSTAEHFVMGQVYANPQSSETLYKRNLGMRPVGGVRMIGPDYSRMVIVGFDALELHDVPASAWRHTQNSEVTDIAKFGYMLADASVTVSPAVPFYIMVEVDTSGNITVASAESLADLEIGNPNLFNENTGLTPLSGNKNTSRVYAIEDASSNVLGSLTFRFVANDISLKRRVIFEFPSSFQGWKQINPAIEPEATAAIASGAISRIDIDEPAVSYVSAPIVVITGDGTGATAVATINEYGVITNVEVTDGGAGYTEATVSFVGQLSSVQVVNGGKDATFTVALVDGGIDSVTVAAGGDSYINPPALIVVDEGGDGFGARLQAVVADGEVVRVDVIEAGEDYVDPVILAVPAGVIPYEHTVAATFGAFTTTAGAMTTLAVTDGGHNYPAGARIRVIGGTPTTEAVGRATVNSDGVITAVTWDEAGAGYDDLDDLEFVADIKDPVVAVTAEELTTTPEVTLNTVGNVLRRVQVLSSGCQYSGDTAITAVGGLAGGGTAAVLEPVIEDGRITQVKILDQGGPYETKPTFSITGSAGANAYLEAELGAVFHSATLVEPGAGDFNGAEVIVGVPLRRIDLTEPGSGYLVAPAVTIGPPDDPNGDQAEAVAILGAALDRIAITNGGTGYVTPSAVTITPSGGGGAGIVLRAIIEGGILTGVEVISPGQGYTSAPGLVVAGGGGADATVIAIMTAVDTLVRIDVTKQGSGYAQAPTITIAAPDDPDTDTNATAVALLLGEGLQLKTQAAGLCGDLMPTVSGLSTGNGLQVFGYQDDLRDSSTVPYARPAGASFYYNVKADPTFRTRYPAVPEDNMVIVLNGVELEGSKLNEATVTFGNTSGSAGYGRKTVFWLPYATGGCPWDAAYSPYAFKLAADGQDNVIPDSGDPANSDLWWRWTEKTYDYEPILNKAWAHINRTSRYFSAAKVESLAVMSPLKLVDLNTGAEFSQYGTPRTGSLLLTLEDQVNILGGTRINIDLTASGERQAIYINNTSRRVVISSIIVIVAAQSNIPGLAPAATNCAFVTIGTQSGNFRDIVGTPDPADPLITGIATHLYTQNQYKEMFPDTRSAWPLIVPNQTVYLRVDAPASSPIARQIVYCLVKGHII